MLLAVDIGNTHIVAGLYPPSASAADDPAAHWRMRTERDATADEVAAAYDQLLGLRGLGLPDVTRFVLSSVVPSLTHAHRAFTQQYLGEEPLVVGPGVRTGMRVRTDSPHEVGADRVVNAIAAFDRYRRSCIVIDMGTATTLDAVGDDGSYLGGAIAPGLGISIDALVAHAARLSTVDLRVPERAIGTNTTASMQSGALLGTVAQLEGMLSRFRAELGDDSTPAIATGGIATTIASHVAGLNDVDPLLTLRGLLLVVQRHDNG